MTDPISPTTAAALVALYQRLETMRSYFESATHYGFARGHSVLVQTTPISQRPVRLERNGRLEIENSVIVESQGDAVAEMDRAFLRLMRDAGNELRAKIQMLGGDPGKRLEISDEDDKPEGLYVVYDGDLGGGFTLYGPYGSEEEASNAADGMNISVGNVLQVNQPPKRG